MSRGRGKALSGLFLFCRCISTRCPTSTDRGIAILRGLGWLQRREEYKHPQPHVWGQVVDGKVPHVRVGSRVKFDGVSSHSLRPVTHPAYSIETERTSSAGRGPFAAPKVRWIFAPQPLFQSPRYTRMPLPSGDQVRKTHAGRVIGIERRLGRRKQVLHPHSVERRVSMRGMKLNTRGKEELFEHDVQVLLETHKRPRRSVLFTLNQLNSGLGVMADERDVRPAQDAADFHRQMDAVGARPLPFDRQLEGLLSECPLHPFRVVESFALPVSFRILSKDRRVQQMQGQRLPKENICIEMYEGPILKAVGKQFPQRPPTGIGLVQLLEFCGYMYKAQPQAIYQQFLSSNIGHQRRFRIVTARRTHREPPGQQMVQGLEPQVTVISPKG